MDPVTVPLHARSVLQSLADGSFERLSFLVGSLRSLLDKPARLDQRLRAASLFAVPIFIVAFLALIVIGDRAAGGPMTTHDGLPEILLLPILTLFALESCLAVPQLLTLLALRAPPRGSSSSGSAWSMPAGRLRAGRASSSAG